MVLFIREVTLALKWWLLTSWDPLETILGSWWSLSFGFRASIVNECTTYQSHQNQMIVLTHIFFHTLKVILEGKKVITENIMTEEMIP